MKGLRDKKNSLKLAIYEIRDHLINELEDKEIGRDGIKELFGKLIDHVNEYFRVCNDLEGEWNVYEEVDKIARLKAENDRIRSDMQEVTNMVNAYAEGPQLSRTEQTPSPIAHGAAASLQVDKIEEMITDLEVSLTKAKQQQKELYSQLGIQPKFSTPITVEQPTYVLSHDDPRSHASRSIDPRSHASRSMDPRSMSPRSHDQRSSDPLPSNSRSLDLRSHQTDTPDLFTQGKELSDLEKALKALDVKGAASKETKRVQQRSNPIEDPMKGLQRLNVPHFKGDKRSFESWHAAFYQTIGKHEKIPPEQKLLRLYSCLEGEALRTVQNLGYSGTAYEVAINRLVRKYGGKRREISLRLEELEKFRRVREGNAADLEQLAELLDTLVVKLTDAGQVSELGAGSLYVSLLRKLNEQLVVKYQDWLRDKHLVGTVHNLYAFINEEAESWMTALETVKGLGAEKPRFQNTGRTLAVPQVRVEEKKQAMKCHLCSQEHGLWSCDKFKDLSVDDRWIKARELKVCFRCLSSYHRSNTCRSKRLCQINGCRSNHHRLLHNTDNRRVQVSKWMENKPQQEQPKSSRTESWSTTKPTEGEANQPKSYVTSSSTPEYLALRTVPVLLKNGDKSLRINALLDDASTRSYLNKDVANFLNLNGEEVSLFVQVLNDTRTSLKSNIVHCELESSDGQVREQITVHTTNRVTGNMHAIDWSKESTKWPHLKDINFPVKGKRPIVDMLIGLDLSDLHCALEEVRGNPGEPIARLTPLGWTCIGPPSLRNGETAHVTYYINEETQLNSLVKQMWEMEEPRPYSLVRPEDKEAEQIVKGTLSVAPSGYTVGLPWKSDAPSLRNNYPMALRRLESTEKKLVKQPEIAKCYQNVFDKYREKGYVKEVRTTPETEEKAWYLPHFPIVRMDKSTSKVRPVFDASARYKGLSLNDVVHQGPKLQRDLVDVLTRFRRSPVALVCDITEMYLQVHLKPSDQTFHRFLWRNMDTTVPPKVYQFTRVVFGVNASPYMAQLVSQHNAETNASKFPTAAETVSKSTYMDDSMDSTETVEEAIRLYHELKELWSKAGMTPKKWMSNKSEVLKAIPKEDCVKSLDLEADVMPVVKTLGISWMSEPDQFTFVVHPPANDFRLTKRSFLSRTSTLFDPLGFISPYTIRARMILQEMWTTGITWDEDLPAELSRAAMAWFEELTELSDVKVPRSLKRPGVVIDSQLHVFTDASQEAYGAVAFLRHCYESGDVTVRFVLSRAKVTPLHSISIPRLELMAAVVGLQIAEKAVSICEMAINKVTFWTDSEDVLYWVRGRSRQFKPFVANRVGEIQSKTDPSQWRYTPTKINPADKLSRGLPARTLVNDVNWWEGPEFLKQPQEKWPVMNLQPSQSINSTTETKKQYLICNFSTQQAEELEINLSFLSLLKKEDHLNPTRYSSWTRMVRVAAYVIRFISNCRLTSKIRVTGALSPQEIRRAEVYYIRLAQLENFPEEIASLKAERKLPCTSRLLPLSPRLDEDGLVRCNGRLQFTECLSWESRFPIILPRKHAVTSLIIRDAHSQCKHGGTNQVLAQLSSKYWIISAREAIRDWERECATCRRTKAKPASQIMAPLSNLRTRQSLRAFSQASVDFAGPFLTKQGRGKTRQKRYLCLFTCLSCRAVHLEMAYSMDTDSFLNAFYRMVSRRGLPELMVSDNGTNFVSGDRELKELVMALNKDKIQDSTANKGIKWHFNPPGAPHFNGVHEVMIKAAKKAIKAILGNADITDEELTSAIVGAEGLINSRPLTYQSANASDEVPLTPNHFLHGQMGGQFAPDTADSTDFNPRKRWRRVQELVRHFWQRWLREWLPALSPRGKWLKTQEDLKVGDLVLVISPDTPRGKWPLGRIIKTYPGSDGHVRTADVQLKDNVLKRPIVKLCPIEK